MNFLDCIDNVDKKFGFSFDRINSNECRFHAIYFLDNETGSLLISNRYSNNISFLKDDLICSFLNAIDLFINELKEGANEELREINFSDTRILYEREGRLLVIAITKKTNLQVERGILREIVNDFYIRFKNFINNFDGAVDPDVLSYKKRLKNMNLNSLFKFNIHI
ncbi:hypothetical protein LCGC14_1444780 [marine sediment metagenome]|jgi:hypothetical protein|uniref:Roadblock/LAMTOR2 domain-containing protein n=1 Tax=marine sediment metagenome TaxID=412755 RepID=A0A0F9JK83_9ZZZZ|nr:hypothetical protein [archaeon]